MRFYSQDEKNEILLNLHSYNRSVDDMQVNLGWAKQQDPYRTLDLTFSIQVSEYVQRMEEIINRLQSKGGSSCVCGAEKSRTTHSDWCTVNK